MMVQILKINIRFFQHSRAQRLKGTINSMRPLPCVSPQLRETILYRRLIAFISRCLLCVFQQLKTQTRLGAHLGSCDSTRVLSKFYSEEPNHNTFKRQIFHRVTAQNKSNTFHMMEATQFRQYYNITKTNKQKKTHQKNGIRKQNKSLPQTQTNTRSPQKTKTTTNQNHKTIRHLARCSTQPLTSWEQAKVRKRIEKYQSKIITSKLSDKSTFNSCKSSDIAKRKKSNL